MRQSGNQFLEMFSATLEEAFPFVTRVPPFRAAPKRTYTRKELFEWLFGGAGAPRIYEHTLEHVADRINSGLDQLGINYWVSFDKFEVPDFDALSYAVSIRDKRSQAKSNIADAGFGLSQLIPLIAILEPRWVRPKREGSSRYLDNEPHLVAIEQPELHLHPAPQAAFAELAVSQLSGRYKCLPILL